MPPHLNEMDAIRRIRQLGADLFDPPADEIDFDLTDSDGNSSEGSVMSFSNNRRNKYRKQINQPTHLGVQRRHSKSIKNTIPTINSLTPSRRGGLINEGRTFDSRTRIKTNNPECSPPSTIKQSGLLTKVKALVTSRLQVAVGNPSRRLPGTRFSTSQAHAMADRLSKRSPCQSHSLQAHIDELIQHPVINEKPFYSRAQRKTIFTQFLQREQEWDHKRKSRLKEAVVNSLSKRSWTPTQSQSTSNFKTKQNKPAPPTSLKDKLKRLRQKAEKLKETLLETQHRVDLHTRHERSLAYNVQYDSKKFNSKQSSKQKAYQSYTKEVPSVLFNSRGFKR